MFPCLCTSVFRVSVPLCLCASASLSPCLSASLPLFLCAFVPLCICAYILLGHCASVPLWLRDSMPLFLRSCVSLCLCALCRCASAPLWFCVYLHLCHYASVPLFLCASKPLCLSASLLQCLCLCASPPRGTALKCLLVYTSFQLVCGCNCSRRVPCPMFPLPQAHERHTRERSHSGVTEHVLTATHTYYRLMHIIRRRNKASRRSRRKVSRRVRVLKPHPSNPYLRK